MAAISPALLWFGEDQILTMLYFCPGSIFQSLPGPNDRVWHGDSKAMQVDSLTCCNWVIWCGHQLQIRHCFWEQLKDNGWEKVDAELTGYRQNMLVLQL